MKKLNITKEQFNRSSYFRNKYGKLEYVSESGKLFKTNKDKVLMFKESIKDIAPGIQDWGTTVYIEELGAELDWKDVYDFVKADCRLYPLLEQDIGVEPYEEPSDKQIRKWIKTKPESFIDYLKEFGYYDYANGKDNDDLEYESTRKFGRKFNESDDEIVDAVQDAYDKYRACSTEPKVCHAVKINDDGTEEKVGISMTRGNSIGGIVKAIQDGRLRKVLKFSESTRKFGKKFNENRVSQGTGNKELDKLNRFQSKVNSIHDQLENLISKYWSEKENDPDMETYIDLLEDAEQKLLRVSADLYERIHMG